mgnify:CR=1 FL=1
MKIWDYASENNCWVEYSYGCYTILISNNSFIDFTTLRSIALFYLPFIDQGFGHMFIENNLLKNISRLPCLQEAHIFYFGLKVFPIMIKNVIHDSVACAAVALTQIRATLEGNIFHEYYGDAVLSLDDSLDKGTGAIVSLAGNMVTSSQLQTSMFALSGPSSDGIKIENNTIAISTILRSRNKHVTKQPMNAILIELYDQKGAQYVNLTNTLFVSVTVSTYLPLDQYFAPPTDSFIKLDITGRMHVRMRGLNMTSLYSNSSRSPMILINAPDIRIQNLYYSKSNVLKPISSVFSFSAINLTIMDSDIRIYGFSSENNRIFPQIFLLNNIVGSAKQLTQVTITNMTASFQGQSVLGTETTFFDISSEDLQLSISDSVYDLPLSSIFSVHSTGDRKSVV